MTVKSVPKLITQPEDLWAAIDSARAETGQTRAAWIADACIAKLGNEIAGGLSERPPMGARRKIAR